MYTSHRTIKTA